jgi:hypothetical protein
VACEKKRHVNFGWGEAGRTGHVACEQGKARKFRVGEQVNLERLIDVYRRSRSNFPTQVYAFISSRDRDFIRK